MQQDRTMRIAEALAAELTLEVEDRKRAGTVPPAWERFAVVFSDPDRVRPYLPGNYEVVGWITSGGEQDNRHTVTLIAGHDYAGFTLEDYVIPRLGSGLYLVREVTPIKETSDE